jgi:hypothetical protein
MGPLSTDTDRLRKVLDRPVSASRFRQFLTLLGLADPRRWDRVPCDLNGRYRLASSPSRQHPMRILDLSLGGLRLTSHSLLKPGDRLEIEVVLEPGEAEFCFPARVVHVLVDEERGWTAGVSFPEVPTGFPDLLNDPCRSNARLVW